MKYLLCTLLSCVATFSLFAQSSVNDFLLGSSAQKLNEQCIQLVPDFPYSSGSAWYKRAINLNEPFSMNVCLMLGCKNDAGADGIVFVFHPELSTGFWGEGMGFAGLYPSLGIEFDTYRNYHLADPAADHISIMQNGLTHHGASLLGPIQVKNLEDCERHPLRIDWDPQSEQLDVYLDNELSATYTGDIVNDIFFGNPKVYWGVTAATGRLSNDHQICIKKLVFADADKPLPPVGKL